ncbi:hypothetical protein ACHAWF_007996 [Thalassiosira exigua]
MEQRKRLVWILRPPNASCGSGRFARPRHVLRRIPRIGSGLRRRSLARRAIRSQCRAFRFTVVKSLVPPFAGIPPAGQVRAQDPEDGRRRDGEREEGPRSEAGGVPGRARSERRGSGVRPEGRSSDEPVPREAPGEGGRDPERQPTDQRRRRPRGGDAGRGLEGTAAPAEDEVHEAGQIREEGPAHGGRRDREREEGPGEEGDGGQDRLPPRDERGVWKRRRRRGRGRSRGRAELRQLEGPAPDEAGVDQAGLLRTSGGGRAAHEETGDRRRGRRRQRPQRQRAEGAAAQEGDVDQARLSRSVGGRRAAHEESRKLRRRRLRPGDLFELEGPAPGAQGQVEEAGRAAEQRLGHRRRRGAGAERRTTAGDAGGGDRGGRGGDAGGGKGRERILRNRGARRDDGDVRELEGPAPGAQDLVEEDRRAVEQRVRRRGKRQREGLEGGAAGGGRGFRGGGDRGIPGQRRWRLRLGRCRRNLRGRMTP